MRADHWIERDDAGYAAAHDVLADAMLARFLSAAPGAEQDRMHDLAIPAFLDDRFDRCIAAVDQLADHPVFAKLSGRTLVETLMLRDSDKTMAVLP